MCGTAPTCTSSSRTGGVWSRTSERTVSRNQRALAKKSSPSTRRITRPGKVSDVGVVLDAAVAQPLVVDRPGRPAQDRAAGPVGAIHERQHRDDHGDRQPDEESEHQDAGEAEDGEDEVGRVGPPQAAQRPDVDQVGDGGDDDRPQHRLGQVVEQRHEEQHRHDEEAEEDDARELRLDARRVGHRGPREAGVDGEPLQQAGAEVGDAERDELLVGVHFVVVLGGEGARAGDRLGEADQREGEARRAAGRSRRRA